jgi:asparagine synthetase B (glutamine-hydrolysing)
VAGLAGIFDGRSEADTLRRDVDRMRRTLLTPRMSTDVSFATVRGFACQAPATAKAVAHDDDTGTCLVFDGELYDRGRLVADLGEEDAATVRGDADLCLRLLLAQGEEFVERLNGQFNLVIYHAADERLSIATDRFGYRPLFVAERGSRFLFATAMKAILVALETAPAIDGIGLLQSMQNGWPLGTRTWFEGIHVAEPGCWLHITPAGVSRSRYFRLRFESGGEASSMQEYAEGLADVLRRSVKRRMGDNERVAIPLSGGLDSRALLLATSRERPPALTYTFGRADSFDVTYARRLADVAGVRHQHFPYAATYLGDILAGTVWFTEGLNPFAQVSLGSLHSHDRIGTEADVLLYGHCGDCLTGAHLPPSIFARWSRARLIERVARQYNQMPEAAVRRVFNQAFYRRYASDLFGAVRDTFAGIEGATAADVLDVWDMENRQRRGTFGSTAVDRHRFEVRAPFIDNDVVDHVRKARLSWRLLQNAYKRMHRTVFRDAAEIPWAYTGRRLSRSLAEDFLQHGLNYVARRLPRAQPDPRELRDLAAETRSDARLAQAVKDFVVHPGFPAEIFDRKGIEETVAEHWGGQRDLTHLVVMLATFATAWRLFLFESPTAIPAEIAPA